MQEVKATTTISTGDHVVVVAEAEGVLHFLFYSQSQIRRLGVVGMSVLIFLHAYFSTLF